MSSFCLRVASKDYLLNGTIINYLKTQEYKIVEKIPCLTRADWSLYPRTLMEAEYQTSLSNDHLNVGDIVEISPCPWIGE